MRVSNPASTLLTEACGFAGRALCSQLKTAEFTVIAAVRHESSSLNEVVIGKMDSATDWTATLTNFKAVVHLAARGHDMRDMGESARSRWNGKLFSESCGTTL
jgi:nucleoside-diphosphate-sugar epimerase